MQKPSGTLAITDTRTVLERVPIAQNLRHDQLDTVITEAWLSGEAPASSAVPEIAALQRAHPGQNIGLYVWADWCPICTAQQGTIDGVQADYPVLTVAMQSGDAAAVNKVLAERGLDWTTAIDTDGRIAQTYGLRGVPAFVIVDPAGAIRSVSLGYTTGWGLRARLWWAGLSS